MQALRELTLSIFPSGSQQPCKEAQARSLAIWALRCSHAADPSYSMGSRTTQRNPVSPEKYEK